MCHSPSHKDSKVNPARAGMIPISTHWLRGCLSKPRASGDDPAMRNMVMALVV